MKLRKKLYGLCQSLNNWFRTMHQCLGNFGFRPPKSDPCVYINEDEVDFVILTLYTDDILLLGATKLLLNKLKKQMMGRFGMTDMGDVSSFRGMNVARDRKKGTSIIYQRNATERCDRALRHEGLQPLVYVWCGTRANP